MTKSNPAPGPILFGTAGPPETASRLTSLGGMEEAVRLGLDTMELEFVQGVKMGVATAGKVGTARAVHGIPLSVHAPYFVNLASPEPDKRQASMTRVLDAARIGALCGADQVVFHPGFFMQQDPERVAALMLDAVRSMRDTLDREGLGHVILRPELTGKPSQFGSPDELFTLCREVPRALPCLDFSHHFTRTLGRANSFDDFRVLLEHMGEALGQDSLLNIHAHLSGIEYGPKGERRHLNMDESEMDFKAVLKALHALGCRGRIICESPDRGRDALRFKRYWNRYLKNGQRIRK